MMKKEELDHFRMQFERENSKYNRLWVQLSSLIIFFIGTLFLLIIKLMDTHGKVGISILFALMMLLGLFCAIAWASIWSEMSYVKPSIDGILYLFETEAYKTEYIEKPNKVKVTVKKWCKISLRVVYTLLIIASLVILIPFIIGNIVLGWLVIKAIVTKT